jgi:hypothetical protein
LDEKLAGFPVHALGENTGFPGPGSSVRLSPNGKGTSSTRAVSPPWIGWLFQGSGTLFALFWGFAEGTLFFILPDVELSLVALYRPRRGLTHMAAIVAGAVLGGALMFVWSEHSPVARQTVSCVPAVTHGMFDRAARDLREYGAWGTALGPVRGIPYKVYAIEGSAYSPFLTFLLVSAPARLWRLIGVWLGFSGAGVLLRKLNRASYVPAVHALFWVATYAIYWTTVK